ncbi:hypothetical protein J3E72DRAFT_439256 [Bipolaris maydis]|nr:hypothetical protein J3E74DRAFT_466274 [Bipolaris maydis]KAJ6197209.1 hypothetical protein J3E72DRAFT_439256 [Bipolaris maydis]
MPFDFDAYEKKCSQMSPEELHLEWNHYTRLISGAAASATLGGSALVFTGGISIIGVAIGSAGFYNARKKRQILKRHLDQEYRKNRKRDMVGSAAFNGAVGLTTLGLGTLGAEKVLEMGIENGVATGVVVNGVNTAADNRYHTYKKKREAKRAGLVVERKHKDGQKKRSSRVK